MENPPAPSGAMVLERTASPRRLTPSVNSDAAESRASLSRDGTRLYFGSTRANVGGDTGADVYMSTRIRTKK
jgi:hypothetical protein